MSGRTALAALAGALALVAVMALVLAKRPRQAPAAKLDDEDAGPVVPWCSAGLEPIPGGGCFAGGDLREPRPLIVYLHGIHGPGSTAEELDRQARLARHGSARGFAVLALRGRQGQCTAPHRADAWCWPSNERTASAGPAVVASWAGVLREAGRRAGYDRQGGRETHRYLLGFSNGGYFAALIATRALMPFDAVAIAHAGPVEPVRAAGPKPPLLLLTADEDPSIESMLRLDAELSRQGWAHGIVTRDGGHALTDSDITAALTFFTRSSREPLPLVPPLSTRQPRPRLGRPDASLPAPAADGEEAGPSGESPAEPAPANSDAASGADHARRDAGQERRATPSAPPAPPAPPEAREAPESESPAP